MRLASNPEDMDFAQHIEAITLLVRNDGLMPPFQKAGIQLADNTVITYRKVIRYVSRIGEQCRKRAIT